MHALGDRRFRGAWRKAFFIYYMLLFLGIGIGTLFDSVFVLPLVEIDTALTIVELDRPVLQLLRSAGFMTVPITVVLVFYIAYLRPVFAFLARPTSAPSRAVLSRVLRAPQACGAAVFAGWMAAFAFITIVDMFKLGFPVPGQRIAYVLTTFFAMLATAILSYMTIYLSSDYLNRKLMIPRFFPDGNVSSRGLVRPMTFTAKLFILWLAVSVYPLVVLGVGFYPRGVSDGLQRYAWAFIVWMIPIGALLVRSTARSFQNPVRALLAATERIERQQFDVELRSDHNDELGHLIDRTVQVARSLEEKRRITETFGKVVDPRVRDHLLAGNIALGGARHQAAVVFCDIRGFTTYSEKRSEEAVVSALNEHLAAMERCVHEAGGMINKFIGDGLLALFGVPVASANPAEEAYTAAIGMLAMNRTLNRARVSRGDAPWRLGIGLHYGPVLAGNIGSPNRMEYTAIGDTVNLAARIQEYSKRLPGQLFLTEAVNDLLGDGNRDNTSVGSVAVRGRDEPVMLYMYQESQGL